MHHIAESCSTYSVVSRANADIAHVRVKAKQEQVAYQASLRKEQMKVDSLERTLEQKVSSTSRCSPSDGIQKCEIICNMSICVTEQGDRGAD